MNSLNIAVDSWIIQDGNYGDFVKGQHIEFAIEFYPKSLTRMDCQKLSITAVKLNQYRICGKVVYREDDVWVLDFGILAYNEGTPPESVIRDSWVEGEICLGIDPFTYFEGLKKIPGMPALTYRFRIDKILLETTPWVESANGKMRTRDTQRESFQEVNKTDAWTDDNGNAGYILECSWVWNFQD